MRRDAGFTLVELMVVLAVAAILATVAIPGFSRLVAEQRVVTATNQFIAALHLTRSEAVRRGTRVTLCASADGVNCGAVNGYTDGWIIFEGPAPGAPLAPVSPPIRVFPGSSVSITGNVNVAGYVSFLATGEARRLSGALPMGTVTVCDGHRARQVIINRTGRPRVEPSVC